MTRVPLRQRETIEQPGAARGDEILLAAAAAGVRGVPRRVAAARAIVVTELRGPGAVARPVLARVIGAVGERRPIQLRAGEHVVPVRRVSHAVVRFTFFGERGLLGEVVAADDVAVQVSDIRRNDDALALCHGPAPFDRARIGFPLVSVALGIRHAPRRKLRTRRLRQRIAVRVRTRQTARFGGSPFPTLVMKNVIGAGARGCAYSERMPALTK